MKYNMYRLVLVNKHSKTDDLKFIIMFYVTIEEFRTHYWKDWCETHNWTIEIAEEDIVYINESEYPIYLCSLKTFWLDIFKRIWRKKHSQIVERKKLSSLIYRSIRGKFKKKS
tara:strand:- start:900 stop:1238 length:339 start_codon:yes stop_codon:yes gene_type:complete